MEFFKRKTNIDFMGLRGYAAAFSILLFIISVGTLYVKGLNLKKDSAPLGVIDFTVNFVNFLVVARGSVVFCRSIPLGIKNLIEDADGPSFSERKNLEFSHGRNNSVSECAHH